MRIGVCANMNATGSDGVGLEWLEQYRRLGFDYVEKEILSDEILGRKQEILDAQLHLTGGATC